MTETMAASDPDFQVAFQFPAKLGAGVAAVTFGCTVVSTGAAVVAVRVAVGAVVIAVPEDDVHPAMIMKMQAMPARRIKTACFIIQSSSHSLREQIILRDCIVRTPRVVKEREETQP